MDFATPIYTIMMIFAAITMIIPVKPKRRR